jgi:hypothetical protein
MSNNGALRTVPALVPSGNFIGTSTADVRIPLIVRSGNRVMLAPGMLDTLSVSLLHRQDNFWVFDEREIKYAEESASVHDGSC